MESKFNYNYCIKISRQNYTNFQNKLICNIFKCRTYLKCYIKIY